MGRRSNRANEPAALARALATHLESYAGIVGGLSPRERANTLIPIGDSFRDLGSSAIEGSSGKARILNYLLLSVRSPVLGRELAIIAGIDDWPRRVRELRVEQGWPIYSTSTLKQILKFDADQARDIEQQVGLMISDMEKEAYVLVSEIEDENAAETWAVLNSIRKDTSIKAKAKILAFLRRNAGRAVSGEHLRYLANGSSEWARRVRELRTEEGWPVLTRMQGRPDIPAGAYMLARDQQTVTHDRKIPDPVRYSVLKRDGFACVKCGWTREGADPDDPRKFLELHHLEAHAKGGRNSPENLITLCNVDHDEIHSLENGQ